MIKNASEQNGEVLAALTECDQCVQSAADRISELVKSVKALLKPEGNLALASMMLDEIADIGQIAANEVNAIAEDHAANFTGDVPHHSITAISSAFPALRNH